MIERIAREIQESGRATIEIEGSFTDLPGDEALLRQARVNLTHNAIEATAGSRVAPRVLVIPSIEELGNRKWLRICIADNGPGIPENDLTKIFLPFFTTKSEGTGLGLAVVQKIALQHGRSIEACNNPVSGAQFLLWLPLRQELSPSLFPSQPVRI